MINIATLRKRLKEDYQCHAHDGGWRKVAEKYGISGAMAYRIANSDYNPKDPHIRVRLDLPALAEAPVCLRCGDVHVTKRCTKQKPPTRWADYSPRDLRHALENREEFHK